MKAWAISVVQVARAPPPTNVRGYVPGFSLLRFYCELILCAIKSLTSQGPISSSLIPVAGSIIYHL